MAAPLKMQHRFGIEIKGRRIRAFTHQLHPFLYIIDALFILGRVFIEEQGKKIYIILEEMRDEVIRMLQLFCIEHTLSILQPQLNDLL